MTTNEDRRHEAIGRLKAKRDIKTQLAAYLVVNAGLVLIWALTGAGYFWPIWPIGGWGIGLALSAWAVYQRPISEDQIRTEMERGGPGTS